MNLAQSARNLPHEFVLDIGQALRDVGEDRDLLSELAMLIAEDAPKLCSEIATAVREKSSQLSQRLSHNLKGMAAQMRAEPTASVAAKIENLSQGSKRFD